MNYVQTFKRVLEIRKIQPFLLCHFGKYFSAIITPIFIYFNISANFITISRFILCVFSLVGLTFYYTEYFSLFLFSYFVTSWLLDFVDGDIARVQNKSTFVGRYMDGLFDMLLKGLICLSLGFIMYEVEKNIIYMWIGSLGCIMLIVASFNIDRYSAFRRWIMEEQQIDIGSHQISDTFKSMRSFFNSLSPTMIILMIFVGYNYYLIFAFLLQTLIWQIIYFALYLFMFTNNAKNIADIPKHDGTGRVR